jgi:hypothetical protein
MTKEPSPQPLEQQPPPRRTDSAVVIVCESDGHWAVAMRREAGTTRLPLRETRSLAQSWELLARHAASLVVVELTRANLEGLLARLAWLRRDYPRARLAVVMDRRLAGAADLVREAGAVHVVMSPRRVKPLVYLARRHVEASPRQRRSVAVEVWEELPWGKAT